MKEYPSWQDLAEGEERSCDDITSAFSNFISNSGTYTIKGDSLIREAIVAKSPNYVNDRPRTASAFTLNGDQLTTSGRQTVWTYKRRKSLKNKHSRPCAIDYIYGSKCAKQA